MPTPTKRPMLLVILDGFGYSDTKEHNAIANASTPTLDELWQDYPHTLISGSGQGVGLPADQMGNSEVGHLNLGAGRVVYQEFTRISKAIEDGSFFNNPILTSNIDKTIKNDKAIHILGLASPGGVHSHLNQLLAMIELAARQGAKKVYVHAFLDGRDTPPKSAKASLQAIEKKCAECGVAKIASLCGRFYAMDRDNRWERIEAAYDLLTTGRGLFQADSAIDGLNAAYDRGETDEFVKPTSLTHEKINDGDTVIFMNFRADRAREITRAFTENEFNGFKRHAQPTLQAYICLTQYDATFNTPVAFAPTKLTNVLGEHLEKLGLKQLRIAETEKYAHVTFFFNGGIEKPFDNEDRKLIPSPKVATYDLQPDMNAPLVTDKLIDAINSDKYDCIVCNYANADMVGHTGNFDAAIKAIECLDQCIYRLNDALTRAGGEMLITADHGNADRMHNDKTDQPHTAHTTNPVPFIYVGRHAKITKQDGTLADVAPTMLYLMGLDIPHEMTGKPLLTLD